MRVFLSFPPLLFLTAVLGAQTATPALPNQGLEVVQRFGGPAKMVVAEDLESKEPLPLILTDQVSFEKFTLLLPPTMAEISKSPIPVPNQDPLVKAPRLDWSRYFLLVVFDSQSLSFPPNISRVDVQGDGLVATVEYPDMKSFIEPKPPTFGSYGAALVVRPPKLGTLTWNDPGHRAQEAQRDSMMLFMPKTDP